MEINDLGTFKNINEVWERYPEGGKEGDFVTIGVVKHRWNKYERIWENAENVTESGSGTTKVFDGDVTIEKNLTVLGRIFNDGMQIPNCGLYATIEALRKAHPHPEVGMWAVVGNTMPGDMWRCDKPGEWKATGTTGGAGQLDANAITEAAKKADNAQAASNKVQGSVDTLKKIAEDAKSIANEAQAKAIDARGAADAAANAANAANTTLLGIHNQLGKAGGIAKLNEHGKIPLNQLPDEALTSGGNVYNATAKHLTTFADFMAACELVPKKERISGLIVTALVLTEWQSRQYVGNTPHYDTEWKDPTNWRTFGDAGGIKEVEYIRGTDTAILTPNKAGRVQINIPAITVDETLTQDGTNPVQGKAIAAALANINAGKKLRLNTIESGGDKAFSITLLDEEDNELSTTEQFTGGGGGGNVAATKIVLERITGSLTTKVGAEAKLQFRYDHIDTSTNGSTGTPAVAEITIIRGANVNIITMQLQAGSIHTIDATRYIGVGTNTIRMKVTAGEEESKQVSSLTWTVTAVQLTLASSFDISTDITRGDRISVPFALTGSGQKTLRCFVDGIDTEDRTINASSANGAFSIDTSRMSHGSHGIALVAELELPSGLIKSNVIYFDIAVRENGNDRPIVAARFDYSEGSGYTGSPDGSSRPYIEVPKFGRYTLPYAVWGAGGKAVTITEGTQVVSSRHLDFVRVEYSNNATTDGELGCKITCGETIYTYALRVGASQLNISEPIDNMALKLSAAGRSNEDVNREEWKYKNISTRFSGFKWGGDGWIDGALHLTGKARATIGYKPLSTDAMAFSIRLRVSDVTDDEAVIVRCIDGSGHGFEITAQEARFISAGGSEVARKFATGEIYNIGFVSYPTARPDSTDDERLNSGMMYLFIDGGNVGAVQKESGDSVRQARPTEIVIGSDKCHVEVFSMRGYTNYLTADQMHDAHMLDLGDVDALMKEYAENDILDDKGNVTPAKAKIPYIIVTGKADNGTAMMLQAAINNNKKTKYPVQGWLFVDPNDPVRNFKVVGGHIRLQGTSSLAYPIKNYRLYSKKADKASVTEVTPEIWKGCDAQGQGGTKLGKPKIGVFAGSGGKTSAAVDCWCAKADYAESSSAHNTGMARLANDVLKSAGTLTPPQRYSSGYDKDIRTTVDGFPILLFSRATEDDEPVFLGKYNFNNDKSTEEVYGFRDIPGYHDAEWVRTVFGGKNPTECWEFLNNDYSMGSFLDADFDVKDTDGTPKWLKVFEARFPDDDALNAEYKAAKKKPKYLQAIVEWVKSTKDNPQKFAKEASNYFNINALCDYYTLTDVNGCADQRVKNMMLCFFYDPNASDHPVMGKMRGFFIFYDNDTILGLRNDGRNKYPWWMDENTLDEELSVGGRRVYAYAGHDSVLWNNLRTQFADELRASYVRLRSKMSNDLIFDYFDNQQTEKFCTRVYNIDGVMKYVRPKTVGVGGKTYSFLESMQGSRSAHRRWWLGNRLALFDARYRTGNYTRTDLAFKGNSAAGATIRAWSGRDWYMSFVREGSELIHKKVAKGEEFSYTYGETANIGTIFHLYGCEHANKIDLSEWGGFTDLTLPTLPRLETLVLGRDGKGYALTEFALGNKVPMLRVLDIRNYIGLAGLDLSGCNLLEEVNASGCTALSSMTLAEGSPIRKLVLPNNFSNLSLRSLHDLTRTGLEFANIGALQSIRIENCAGLDAVAIVKEALTAGANVKWLRLRANMVGDGQDLLQWMRAGIGGMTPSGEPRPNRGGVMGKYQLTNYMAKDEFNALVAYYDGLEIRQPEYTIIELTDAVQRGGQWVEVSSDANVSNHDNKTGLLYNNTYRPSGHVQAILDARHRVLAKMTTFDTLDPSVNEMTYCQLDDADSNYFHDGTPAVLDGSMGEVFVTNPHFWYKGVNDYFGRKNIIAWSSNKERPSVAPHKTINLDAIKAAADYEDGKEVFVSSDNVLRKILANYAVCTIDMEGWKRVRFCTAPAKINVFVDSNGRKVGDPIVTSDEDFDAGMYVVVDVPANAVKLSFTICNVAVWTDVVLTNSTELVDIEPDWVEHTPRLVSAVRPTEVAGKPRCVMNGATPTGGNISTLNANATQVGKRALRSTEYWALIVGLFVSKYGRRNASATCGLTGYAQNKNGTNKDAGMRDTFIQGGLIKYTRKNGEEVTTPNTSLLGYENCPTYSIEAFADGDRIVLNQYAGVPHSEWTIETPSGQAERYLLLRAYPEASYLRRSWWGKHLNVTKVGTGNATGSTYWSSVSSLKITYPCICNGNNGTLANIASTNSILAGWQGSIRYVFSNKMREEKLPIEFMKLKDKIFDV